MGGGGSGGGGMAAMLTIFCDGGIGGRVYNSLWVEEEGAGEITILFWLREWLPG
ncbi:hypothetical protein T06_12524 [Trichinella sp. T6]|nr:hypothetical protein T06_12524 [Trichinella sp. T6]